MSLLGPATFCLMALLAGPVPPAEEGPRLYGQVCARCHGPAGEGTRRFPRQLEGGLSLAQLTQLIHKTMPEDGPGTLSLREAQAVAEHIYRSFYSAEARERARPARVSLARLTVEQHRQALADLVGSFRWQPRHTEARGLRAEYYKGRSMQRGSLVLERTDPKVDFDFKTGAPVPGKTEPEEFSIRWHGSLIATETGEHTFTVKTEHAARLWVNDLRTPIIDAWVKSGKETEYTGSLYLLAGRSYPLRLEYTKAKQGVDDSKTAKKRPPAPSSIALLWKPPHHARSPVPSRQLAPWPSPEVYVCSTPFPPDDRSYGWVRGTTVSREWSEATAEAALDAASYIAARANELAGVRDGDPTRPAKFKAFAQQLASRAFRRPLTEAQTAALDRQLADPENGLKRAVMFILKSPAFLFREAASDGGGYAVAARLSFGLWSSLPDRELLDAAARGQLSSADAVRRQAERMLADPRGKARLRSFLMTWARADGALDLSKDAKKLPGFDALALSDLRDSLEAFFDSVAWSEKSDFRQLLLSEEVPLNARLGRLYGVAVEEEEMRPVRLDNGKRAGALTHPYLLAAFSHGSESSPIHRGVFLARGVLGVALKTPPEAVAPSPPELHPRLSTRERVALQTRPASCMTCHAVINPLGFALEGFDAVGRFREKDNGKPVDARGQYQDRTGKLARFEGARELAAYLADSPEAHEAFIEQMFHHLVQQPVRAYGKDPLSRLRASFVSSGYHIRKLAAEVMALAALPPERRERR
jgi:hypothetical protein